MSSAPRARCRGMVVWAVIDDAVGRKPYVVVSNNQRNQVMNSLLVARIATTRKPALPSVVELAPGDGLTGRVLCDEVMQLWSDEVVEDAGALSPRTMAQVDDGLRHALGM